MLSCCQYLYNFLRRISGAALNPAVSLPLGLGSGRILTGHWSGLLPSSLARHWRLEPIAYCGQRSCPDQKQNVQTSTDVQLSSGLANHCHVLEQCPFRLIHPKQASNHTWAFLQWMLRFGKSTADRPDLKTRCLAVSCLVIGSGVLNSDEI